MQKGSCLCGAVQYYIKGAMRAAVACHCSQCRKTSGHYWSATSVADDDLVLNQKRGLRWYQSSVNAQRGFCCECGASLFWRLKGEGRTSIGAGTLDGQTDLNEQKHIFVKDKGDYYNLPDSIEQIETW